MNCGNPAGRLMALQGPQSVHLYAMPPAASTGIEAGRLTGVDAQSFGEDTTLSWHAGRCASRRTGTYALYAASAPRVTAPFGAACGQVSRKSARNIPGFPV